MRRIGGDGGSLAAERFASEEFSQTKERNVNNRTFSVSFANTYLENAHTIGVDGHVSNGQNVSAIVDSKSTDDDGNITGCTIRYAAGGEFGTDPVVRTSVMGITVES